MLGLTRRCSSTATWFRGRSGSRGSYSTAWPPDAVKHFLGWAIHHLDPGDATPTGASQIRAAPASTQEGRAAVGGSEPRQGGRPATGWPPAPRGVIADFDSACAELPQRAPVQRTEKHQRCEQEGRVKNDRVDQTPHGPPPGRSSPDNTPWGGCPAQGVRDVAGCCTTLSPSHRPRGSRAPPVPARRRSFSRAAWPRRGARRPGPAPR